MQIQVISLFPDMFQALKFGITGRAVEKGLLSLQIWTPRDFTDDERRTVDDRPYGGGPGMVMQVKPLRAAIQAAKQNTHSTKVVYLSPQGKLLTQSIVSQWSHEKSLILVAGRYEGIDERLMETEIDEEWSIGDYVLSGGELPAMVVIDSIARLLPGALGDAESAQQDSFASGLLDYPHYTRPENMEGRKVPEVLLSGDHQAIARWRLKQALGRTWLRRPDLLSKHTLSKLEQGLLEEFKKEHDMIDNHPMILRHPAA